MDTRLGCHPRVRGCGTDQHIDRAVADLERWDVRKEVVTDKEAHEDEIVNHALQIEATRHLDVTVW